MVILKDALSDVMYSKHILSPSFCSGSTIVPWKHGPMPQLGQLELSFPILHSRTEEIITGCVHGSTN